MTRLIKLRRLGSEIEQSAVVDLELQRARGIAARVGARVKRRREETRTAAAAWRTESSLRNAVETADRTDGAREVRQRVAETRAEEAKRARTAHAVRVVRNQKEKEFAVHFVNTSRKLSHESEVRHLREGERRAFAKVRAAVETARQETNELKEKHRRTAKEVAEKKRGIAKHEQVLVEEKRDFQRSRHEESMDRVRDWKKEEKVGKRAAKEARRMPRFFYPNAAPSLETDESEGAALCITQYIGDNIGQIEARLLVDLIASLL
jgi:hypothetical protein